MTGVIDRVDKAINNMVGVAKEIVVQVEVVVS